MPRKDKTSIPGVAEVPMPPAAPAPRAERELQLEITTDKTGVRIKVGAAWAVTLFPRDLRRIGPMLGMDYAKAINERNEALSKAGLAQQRILDLEQQRDEAKREIQKTEAHYGEVLDERQREIDSVRANSRRIVTERDAAIVDRDTWKQNAERDAAELIALADKLNQATQKLRDIEKLRESDTIEMGATILGYRILTVVVFFVVSAIAIWKGVGR
jgi:hypothetical protein